MKWKKTSKKTRLPRKHFCEGNVCHDLRRKLTMHNYSMHNNQQIIKEFIVKYTNKIILMRNSSISNWTPIKVTITKDTIKV